MTYSTLELTRERGIARITLNRADALNAMNRAFWRELPAAFAEIERDMGVRVAVIDARGRHFTAGLDLNEFGDLAADDGEPARRAERLRRMILMMQETFSAIERARVPVLAAVQGACIGGGIDLITACDMRYAAADAFFSVQEINIAITADVGTLQRLPHIVGQGIARELSYTGRRMAAPEARQVGLVNAVFENADALHAGVNAVAAEIAAKAPLAVAGTKRMLNHARDHSVADGLDYVATWNAAMLSPADLKEAFTAQAESRAATYADLLALAE